MAVTAFGALTVQQKIAWATVVTQAGRDKNFFMSNGFVGKDTADMSTPIHRITELTPTEKGTQAILPLVADLQEDGQTGDNMLEGNEEALINDACVIQIDQLRHGVRNKGKMSEQETVLRFRNLAREKLAFWLADIIDELCFLTLSGIGYSYRTDGSTRTGSRLPDLNFAADVAAPSTNRKVFAAGSAVTGLSTSDKMSWDLIVASVTKAKRQRIKPIMNKGKPHYIMVMSSEQNRDLKMDTDYQTILRTAGPRGSDNPLFTNATAVVEGVVIYDHQKVCNTLGKTSGIDKWGSGYTVDGAQALMLGAQALGMATIGQADFNEATFDYGNRNGIAYGRMFGLLKPQFKSVYNDMNREDFSVLSVYTAAAAA